MSPQSLPCRVLELIQEAKWLRRLDIGIPEAAQQVLAQEARFKSYKDHLQLCLSEFNQVRASIPKALQAMFQPHVDAAVQNFQPGLQTLAWNSMNIGMWFCFIKNSNC
jgi:dynein heavy chain